MDEGRGSESETSSPGLAPEMPRCASVKRSPEASRAWMMVSEPRISVASTLTLSGPPPISACSGRMPTVDRRAVRQRDVAAGKRSGHAVAERQAEHAVLPADLGVDEIHLRRAEEAGDEAVGGRA